MAYVVVYKDINFSGVYARMGPGMYRGSLIEGPNSLWGSGYQSTHGEPLNNEISSIKVGQNTIVALHDAHSYSSASPARVLIGPADIPDLNVIGMNDNISMMQVLAFKDYPSGIPLDAGIIVSTGYSLQGKRANLFRGTYDSTSLISAQETNRIGINTITSIKVKNNTIAVLYVGPNMDIDDDAVIIPGPKQYDDLDRIGFAGRTQSIRVLYTDPTDDPRNIIKPPQPIIQPIHIVTKPPPLKPSSTQVLPKYKNLTPLLLIGLFIIVLIFALIIAIRPRKMDMSKYIITRTS